MIHFPEWVKEPTPCFTRTFRDVFPATGSGGRKHCQSLISTVINRPMVIARRNRTGKLEYITREHLRWTRLYTKVD